MPTLAESVGLDPGLQAEVLAYGREHAGAVDADGRKTRDALVWLSRRGLTDLGTGTAEIGGLAKQGAVISTLASVCVSSAFSLWAHRMAIEYIKRFGSSDLRSGVLPSLLSAAVSGSTAMAGGFLDELGLRPLNVSLDLNASPPVLSGSVPWASNLFDTGYVVIVPAADNEGGRYAVAVSSEMTGVRRGPDLDLLALHATASSSVALDDVAIPPEWILRDSLSHFLQAIRPSFLLLQSALCLGLAEAAIDAAGEELTGVAVIRSSGIGAMEHGVGGGFCSRDVGWARPTRGSVVSELPTDIATKLLFENDRIRVWEARLEPGEEFPNHMHSYDYVQVFIEGDKIAATIDPSSGGTWEGHAYVEAEVENGVTIWAEKGSAHNTVNVGSSPFYEILVEIKD